MVTVRVIFVGVFIFVLFYHSFLYLGGVLNNIIIPPALVG